MGSKASFLKSSIGSKWLMAVSGILLLGFVVAHMVGNLKIFLGQDAINHYAVWLRELPFFALWLMRIGLLVAFLVHVASAARLVRENREARPEGYRYRATIQTSYAARTMFMSGLLVAAYILYHLLHLTFGVTHPEHAQLVDAAGRHDVFSMVVLGFQEPLVAAVYVVANLMLCIHLSHGLHSLFQTIGVANPKTQTSLRRAAPAIAVAIFLGYVAVPLAVQLGIVTLPEGVQ